MSTDLEEFARLREERDSRTISEMKAGDSYRQGVVTEARQNEDGSWSLTWRAAGTGSRDCGCRAKEGVTIKPGDTIRLYGEGLGFLFHGIDINDTEMFWETPWERLAERVRWLARYDREQRERFARRKGELDAMYAALSEPMKGRMDRFREAEGDFRIKSEGYEILVCWQAEAFAARAIGAAATGEAAQPEVIAWFEGGSFAKAYEKMPPSVRWLLWWSKLPYDRQRELMPAMDEGHSGNTFAASGLLGVRLLLGASVCD